MHHLQQQGYQNPALDGAGPQQLQDPGFLAQMAGQMQRQQPGMLGLVLGGGSMGMGGMFGGGMLGGGSMGGMLGGRRGGAGSLLGNPLAKAAMAGIARYAFKRVTGR